MYYVPTEGRPSPEAAALGEEIANVIRARREANPDLSSEDVRQAFGVARSMLRGEGNDAPARSLAIGLILGLAGLLGLVVFYLHNANVSGQAILPVVIGVMVVAIAVLLALKRL